MKKFSVLLFSFTALILIMAGCSDKKEETEATSNNEVTNENENNDQNEKEDTAKEAESSDSDADIDFDAIIKEMEDITEGEADVVYENSEAMEEDIEDVHISLDGYVLLELDDFHTDFEIPFKDHTDGGVLLAHYTVENNRDEDVHYQPNFDLSYSGYTRTRPNERLLLPEEVQLNSKLGPSNDYELPKGESKRGYVAYALSLEEMDDILAQGEVAIEVKAAAENYDADALEYKPLIGKDSTFKVAVSDEGSENVEKNKKFYNDSITAENWGEKVMIKEKSDLDESVSLGDSKVTLEGYQFTEFEPNETEAPRFSNFDEGIVVLTLKMDIDNQESEDVGLSSLSSKMDVNNNKQYLLDENMLLDYRNDDVIESGKSGEWLQVYIMDKEEYDKMLKDKPFELTVGPLKSDEAKDISKGKKETIVLPD